MRKGVSIIFVLILLLSGAHVTIATHFCGGQIAATKVSLTGKLASCGMENNEGSCASAESILKSHCCEDHINNICLSGSYTAPIVDKIDCFPNNLSLSYPPADQVNLNISLINFNSSDTGPPGHYSPTSVDRLKIRTIRI